MHLQARVVETAREIDTIRALPWRDGHSRDTRDLEADLTRFEGRLVKEEKDEERRRRARTRAREFRAECRELGLYRSADAGGGWDLR